MTPSQRLTIATCSCLLLLASYVAGYIHLLGSME
jgi:hypothetical protein